MNSQDTKPTTQNSDSPLIVPNTVVKLEIDAQTAATAYSKALKKLAARVKLAGFRKGKVPASLAEQHLGEAEIINQALQQVVPPAYLVAIKQDDKQPLTQPEYRLVSAEKGQAWVVEAEIAEAPAVPEKNYKKIIAAARKQAQKDWLDQQKDKKNEEPPADPAEPAKPEAITPEQEFVLQKIYLALLTEYKLPIPELLVKREVEHDLEHLVRQLQQINLTLDDYLLKRGQTFQDLSSELAASALGRLQISFILGNVIKLEKLEADEAAIDAAIAQTADQEFAKRHRQNPDYRRYIGQTETQKRLADFLLTVK